MLWHLNVLIQKLFPICCAGCGIQTAQLLCTLCMKDIVFISKACLRCGHIGEHQPHTCQTFAFDALFPCVSYNTQTSSFILRFKQGDQLYLADLFSDWLLKRVNVMDFDIVVPVPLHYKRFLSRKFNQSAVLALYMKKKSHVFPTYAPHALRRHTPSQEKKNKAMRFVLTEKAFYATQTFAGKHVLLIDDVFASGATAHACAQALKKAHAARVSVLTVAYVSS